MRSAFLLPAAALCACSLFAVDANAASTPTDLVPAASPTGALAVIAPASASSGGVVAQSASSESVTVSAYTRTVVGCVNRKTGHVRRDRRFDKVVSTVVTSKAGSQSVRLPVPSIAGKLSCRSSERLKRLRISYTDVAAKSATGQAVLIDASFLNSET